MAVYELKKPKDYFVERDGVKFAGTHLLIELWQACRLNDLDWVDQMMREAVAACGATLLNTGSALFFSSWWNLRCGGSRRIAYEYSYVARTRLCGTRRFYVWFVRPIPRISGSEALFAAWQRAAV